jgi:hypothetical protein
MGKLSDFFSMSKQERAGAWIVALFIVVLLVAVAIERKCSSSDVNSQDAKSLNEYVEKAEKSKPREKNKDDKKDKKKSNKKGKKNSNDKDKKDKKSSSQSSKKKEKKSSKDKSKKKSGNNKQRELQPVPQF